MGLLILENPIISSSFIISFIITFLFYFASFFTFSFISFFTSSFAFSLSRRNYYYFYRDENNMSDINEFNIINIIIFFFVELLPLFASLKRLNLKRYKTLN